MLLFINSGIDFLLNIIYLINLILENDTAGAFKSVVDSIGLAMHSLDISEGIHRCLIAAVGGEKINALWMSDNSVPLSNKLTEAAINCIQNLENTDILDHSDSLIVAVRRVVQIYGTILSEDNDNAKEDPRSNFVKPLLARPLLETVVLALSLHRTQLETLSLTDLQTDNVHSILRVNSNPTNDIAAALAGAYLDGERSGDTARSFDYEKCPGSPAPTAASAAQNNLLNVIRWIVMGRLVQLVCSSTCKRVSKMMSSSSEILETKIPDESELPLRRLIVELENIILRIISGRDLDTGETSRLSEEFYFDDYEFDRILIDWTQFIRNVLHLLTRCHLDDELSFSQLQLDKLPKEFSVSKLNMDDVELALNSIGLSSLLTRTPLFESLFTVAKKWIRALFDVPDSSNELWTADPLLSTADIVTHLKQYIDSSGQLGQFIVNDKSAYDTLITHQFLKYSHPSWRAFRGRNVDSFDADKMIVDNLKAMGDRLSIATNTKDGEIISRESIFVSPLDLSSKLELFQFPESYTAFHQRVSSLCTFDYPAICLTCGLILNAGILMTTFCFRNLCCY